MKKDKMERKKKQIKAEGKTIHPNHAIDVCMGEEELNIKQKEGQKKGIGTERVWDNTPKFLGYWGLHLTKD